MPGRMPKVRAESLSAARSRAANALGSAGRRLWRRADLAPSDNLVVELLVEAAARLGLLLRPRVDRDLSAAPLLIHHLLGLLGPWRACQRSPREQVACEDAGAWTAKEVTSCEEVDRTASDVGALAGVEVTRCEKTVREHDGGLPAGTLAAALDDSLEEAEETYFQQGDRETEGASESAAAEVTSLEENDRGNDGVEHGGALASAEVTIVVKADRENENVSGHGDALAAAMATCLGHCRDWSHQPTGEQLKWMVMHNLLMDCENGHPMATEGADHNFECDGCQQPLAFNSPMQYCSKCNYSLCCHCSSSSSTATVGRPVGQAGSRPTRQTAPPPWIPR